MIGKIASHLKTLTKVSNYAIIMTRTKEGLRMDDYSKYTAMPSEFTISYEVENGEVVVNTKKWEVKKHK